MMTSVDNILTPLVGLSGTTKLATGLSRHAVWDSSDYLQERT